MPARTGQACLVPQAVGLGRARAHGLWRRLLPDIAGHGVRHCPVSVVEQLTGVTFAVRVHVGLIGVGDQRAVVAVVADPVAVRVRARLTGVALAVFVRVVLVGVGDGRAVVTGVADAVAVPVRLIRVRGSRAVVTDVSVSVSVPVRLIGVGRAGAVVADVAVAVTIPIRLVGVRVTRAVIADVAVPVAVPIRLIRVRRARAVVADVAVPVAVPVRLIGVGNAGAVIADVPVPVPVPVRLIGVGNAGAVIADVPVAVAVPVRLVGVENARAVIADVSVAIPVSINLIRVRGGGAVVADVPVAVPVPVSLIRVGNAGAVIADVPVAVPVPVSLIRVRGGGAVVADIAVAVAVTVRLVGVLDVDAVVADVHHAVSVRVYQIGITGVADVVTVRVRLVGVGDRGAVVVTVRGLPARAWVVGGGAAPVAVVRDAVTVSAQGMTQATGADVCVLVVRIAILSESHALLVEDRAEGAAPIGPAGAGGVQPDRAVRGCAAVAGVPAVLGPLPDVAGHVQGAGGGHAAQLRADGPGPACPTAISGLGAVLAEDRRVVGAGRRGAVAPWVDVVHGSSGCVLPLRLTREATTGRHPGAEVPSRLPGDPVLGVIRAAVGAPVQAPARPVPVRHRWRRADTRRLAGLVGADQDLIFVDEVAHPDAHRMHRLLGARGGLGVRAAHGEAVGRHIDPYVPRTPAHGMGPGVLAVALRITGHSIARKRRAGGAPAGRRADAAAGVELAAAAGQGPATVAQVGAGASHQRVVAGLGVADHAVAA